MNEETTLEWEEEARTLGKTGSQSLYLQSPQIHRSTIFESRLGSEQKMCVESSFLCLNKILQLADSDISSCLRTTVRV